MKTTITSIFLVIAIISFMGAICEQGSTQSGFMFMTVTMSMLTLIAYKFI